MSRTNCRYQSECLALRTVVYDYDEVWGRIVLLASEANSRYRIEFFDQILIGNFPKRILNQFIFLPDTFSSTVSKCFYPYLI